MFALNTQQQSAVKHKGAPLLVLAGAGSGKTRVITEKIAWLIQSEKVDPKSITAVTFTNKAAREMKFRVGEYFKSGKQDIKGLTISTFHALGMRIIRSDMELAGLKSGFTIVDPTDAINIVGDILARQSGRNAEFAERIYHQISAWKNGGVEPGIDENAEATPLVLAALKIFPEYNRYLRACNSVDLDDLIGLPVTMLQSDERFRNKWLKSIRYLLVDEYQDTNGAQYQLVRQLVDTGSRLTVVGDDDQSIYAWRGARPENLVQLGEDFPKLNVIKLEQNYRSAGRILKIANNVIANNPRPFAKNLWSELGYGDAVTIFPAKDDEAEAEKVVSNILSHQFRHNSKYGDFAILYRSNHQSRILETKLREMRIPYKISGGISFFDRTEVRDAMAYLRLMANNADDAAFMRIINTPRRGIGASSIEKISDLAIRSESSMFDAIFESELAQSLKPNQYNSIKRFAERIVELGDEAERSDPVSAFETLLDEVGYENWLMDSADEKQAQTRWENVLELVDWVGRLDDGQSTENRLSSIIGHMVLSDILDKQDDDLDSRVVNLMTLHASKGLEFKHVAIVGVEEEILPHRNSVMDDAVEEERRLFYVGLTRAMKTLSLSYCRIRRRYGETVSCDPSRFLAELPSEEVEWADKSTRTEEQQQETKQAYIANIRQILNKDA